MAAPRASPHPNATVQRRFQAPPRGRRPKSPKRRSQSRPAPLPCRAGGQQARRPAGDWHRDRSDREQRLRAAPHRRVRQVGRDPRDRGRAPATSPKQVARLRHAAESPAAPQPLRECGCIAAPTKRNRTLLRSPHPAIRANAAMRTAVLVPPATVAPGPHFPIGYGPAQTFVAHKKTRRQITKLIRVSRTIPISITRPPPCPIA